MEAILNNNGNSTKRPRSIDLTHSSIFSSAKKRQKENNLPYEGNVGSGSSSSMPPIPRTPSSHSKQALADRFIPNRAVYDDDYNYYQLTKPNQDSESGLKCTPSQRKLNNQINHLKDSSNKKRLIECRAALTPQFDRVAKASDPLKSSFDAEENDRDTPSKRPNRIIPTAPIKILDAPDIANDYYLNLLHWGSKNILAIALGTRVFLWNDSSGENYQLVELDDIDADEQQQPNLHVSSVQWSKDARLLAVGTSLNTVQLWDVEYRRILRTLQGHNARVSSLSWQNNDVISSGSRDSQIISHDHRIQHNQIARYSGHNQEVCGLAWNSSGTTLASGGNDNLLCLWDAARSGAGSHLDGYQPQYTLDQHIAAVKAVAWCPWQRNILASGGGTADRTIRIWNSSNGSNIKCVDTGSQVCAIQWSDSYRELVSSHGFSDNQLTIWRYSDMTRVSLSLYSTSV